jgi:hypothetical protein
MLFVLDTNRKVSLLSIDANSFLLKFIVLTLNVLIFRVNDNSSINISTILRVARVWVWMGGWV